MNEETKRKISLATRGDKAYWFGKHLSEETKKKISLLKKARYVPIFKNCIICGKQFTVAPHDLKENRTYCSIKCRGFARRKRVIKECPVCYKKFEIKKSHATMVRCCSVGCRKLFFKNRKIIKFCPICNKKFSLFPCQLKENRKCCSRKCADLFRVGKKMPPRSEEFRRKLSESKKGKPSWNTKPYPLKEQLIELYENQKMGLKKLEDVFHSDYHTIKKWLRYYGVKIRDGKEAQKMIQNHSGRFKKGHKVSPELRKRMLRALCKKPTKPEKVLIEIINHNKLPYSYVGNGELLLENRNPDFIHNFKKKIIEVFGIAFHSKKHSYVKLSKSRTKRGTIRHYKKLGYETLILWDLEILHCPKEKLLKKINDFTHMN